jgi:hypothetical protein
VKCTKVFCLILFKCQIFTGLRSLLGPFLFSMVFKPTVYSNFIAGEAQVLPTKRCRLSWLNNSALIYESQLRGEGGGCGVSANEYSCAHHVTWSPNKLWRSTCIFVPTGILPSFQPIGDSIRSPIGWLCQSRSVLPTGTLFSAYQPIKGCLYVCLSCLDFFQIVFFRRWDFIGGFHFSEATFIFQWSSGCCNSQFSRSSIWRNFETDVIFGVFTEERSGSFFFLPLQ